MCCPAKVLPSLVMVLFGVGAVWADDTYYLIVFASQTPDNQPKYAHTFAAFIKAADTAGKTPALETAVISWLPANGIIEVVRLRPEPGKNFGLKETLDWAAALQVQLAAWGPYPIKKELYDSAVRQVKRLESGAVAYKAVELARPTGTVINCIHAVCDLDIVKEHLVTGTARGDAASEMTARFFRPWMIPSAAVPPVLTERLGMTKYKIAARELNPVREPGAASPAN
jgi:hypothetical protein